METIFNKQKVFLSQDNSGSSVVVTAVGDKGFCLLYFSHMLAPKALVSNETRSWAYGNIYGFIDDFCKENELELYLDFPNKVYAPKT